MKTNQPIRRYTGNFGHYCARCGQTYLSQQWPAPLHCGPVEARPPIGTIVTS